MSLSDSKLNSKYKILHVCKTYYPIHGGVQKIVKSIVSGMNSRFENGVLATCDRKQLSDQSSESVIFCRSFGEFKSLPIAISFIPALWKRLNSYEIICVHYPFPLVDFALTFVKPSKAKLVVFWHSEIISQKHLKCLVMPFTKSMLKRADKILSGC